MRASHFAFCLLLGASLLPKSAVGAAALDETISVGAFDDRLLARAVFGETNRVRVAAKLKPFRAEPKLDEAADTQARLGAIFRPPSHTSPFPLIATPADRVKFAGLEPQFVAENIALVPVYDLPKDASVFTTDKDPTLRDTHTGMPVRVHTYASFARAIVAAWMDSPGHRANILGPKLRYLGCAVRPAKSLSGVDMIFGVQAFYTPQRKRF